jgi:hypothetical protein
VILPWQAKFFQHNHVAIFFRNYFADFLTCCIDAWPGDAVEIVDVIEVGTVPQEKGSVPQASFSIVINPFAKHSQESAGAGTMILSPKRFGRGWG